CSARTKSAKFSLVKFTDSKTYPLGSLITAPPPPPLGPGDGAGAINISKSSAHTVHSVTVTQDSVQPSQTEEQTPPPGQCPVALANTEQPLASVYMFEICNTPHLLDQMA